MGIISPVGQGIDDTLDSIRKSKRAIKPLQLFPTAHVPSLPVGEIDSLPLASDLPRTHTIALIAAEEAMKNISEAPDAIVFGVTTGGMSVTEERLKSGDTDSRSYTNHSAGSVAEHVARHVGCKGPVLTVSTACSSGSLALVIALQMLRSGKANQILAGGADSLCRLTYYGFNALQLVDATGAHPFDHKRRGMSVGEGSALLLLTAAETPPESAIAELLGGGLSCDAYHPASPHPQGEGAVCAMGKAIADAAISPEDIDYIHLHGTGTIDNDLAEAKAVNALFGDRPVPPCSSTKGSFGHSLAAAGAIGAVVSTLSISHGIIPANTGIHDPDPALNLIPVDKPIEKTVNVVLANSFGFGGNNAVLIFGHPTRRRNAGTPFETTRPISFSVLGSACLTGVGDLKQIGQRREHDEKFWGLVPPSDIARHLSEKYARRMKRLPRMALALAIAACGEKATAAPPRSVFFGTGWGGLSETHDFLTKLFESDERFTSPTDFIGSVHNAPAGHVAIHFKATGPNVTTTGGDCSFEQALMSASLLTRRDSDPILVIGADEYHPALSPLFDASVALRGTPSDGGGALYLKPEAPASSCRIRSSFLAYGGISEQIIPELIRQLGGGKRIRDQFGTILVGIPAAQREKGQRQLEGFLSLTKYPHPVIDYRHFIGEFASASAVAAVLAVSFVQSGKIPGNFSCGRSEHLQGRGALVMGFGHYVTAMEVMP